MSKTTAAPGGFDLGTSPHGLSVGLAASHQETSEASSLRSPAKPVLTFTLTEAQRSALSFAAQCEAEDLQCGYEAHLAEVQEAIEHLWEARRILEGVST